MFIKWKKNCEHDPAEQTICGREEGKQKMQECMYAFID